MNNKILATKYNLDILLIFVTTLLITVGVIFIYSAGSHNPQAATQPYIKQLLFLIPGLVFFIGFLFVNYQTLSNYWIIFYFMSIILLILVLLIGKKINGARSWFSFGFFSFQPSEIAKLFFIFTLAKYLDRIGREIKRIPFFLLAFSISLPMIGLIIVQPDMGTAIVYIPITLVMLYISGAQLKHLLVVIFIGAISLSIGLATNYYINEDSKEIRKNQIDQMVKSSFIYTNLLSKKDINKLKQGTLSSESNKTKIKKLVKEKKNYIKKIFVFLTIKTAVVCLAITLILFLLIRFVKGKIFQHLTVIALVLTIGFSTSILFQLMLKPHHTTRILSFLNPEKDPRGVGYNQRQAIIAIGSGGIKGLGLAKGTQNMYNYIPEKTTDFIYAVLSEEWGFFGTLLLLFLYFILIYRGVIIAYNAKDYLGTLIAVGITTMFFFHIFINLGMCIGILPVMGLPLPFISAGGSSLLTNLIGISLLLNISQRRYVHGTI